MAINVGILGFAHGHVGAYIHQWKTRPELGVTPLAGWDHDADRLKQAAEPNGIEAYDDVDQLLAEADVQAVVISAETSKHAELVEKAAAAGKAIAVQKPIALTLAEADRIVAAVEKHGVPFTMLWQMRVDPQNLKIKELIESGDLGQVFMVRRRHGLATHHMANFKSLFHVVPELNRDIFADDAAHPIDFLHWLLGVPETVMAEMDTLFDPEVVNDNAIAIFRYPGGPMAEVNCSFVTNVAEHTTEVIAQKGGVTQNFGDGPSTTLPRAEGTPGLKYYIEGGEAAWVESDIPSPAGHGERIAGLAEPMAEFFQGKRGPICTAEEGRTSLRMLLACYVSAREGRRVRIDDPAIADV